MKAKSLGICLGASNIKAVELVQDDAGLRIGRCIIRNHNCDPRGVLLQVLHEIEADDFQFGMITGRKLKNNLTLASITEPEAVENALEFQRTLDPTSSPISVIVSLGAENFIVYGMDEGGAIQCVDTGNKCASGTGEFFLQQIRRMNLSVDEAVTLSRQADPFKVSGRCSVFCKSDCTHALNKGVPAGRVAAGLCGMMVEKILDLLGPSRRKNVAVIGGVTRNAKVIDLLQERIDNLLVPQNADVFEALGAACYALRRKSSWHCDASSIFLSHASSFDTLPKLDTQAALVTFEPSRMAEPSPGDECVVGLDVGSTTTKAVLLRRRDAGVLASVYVRTNGDPVAASRECYDKLHKRALADVSIVGIGTTGSGRYIAALHASTDAIINEIIAHATAAAHFDPQVDTILEIGGQDAKYTRLYHGVASDYAMNEACSAGTGSFLEESAKESCAIEFTDIETRALAASAPPNFNDQCAAFISSDIKTATHEGIGVDDIAAGLVYSICMNYVNRVVGRRGLGKKIFMQGGVCYNKAVPLAMANLIGKPIVVPPDPGLMGALGVALEVSGRIERGAMQRTAIDLAALAKREISYGKSFTCAGDAQRCDRSCEIAMIVIEGKKIPFGGACNKYYNMLRHVKHSVELNDHVRKRQELVFNQFASAPAASTGPTVGISRAFLTNMLYPLFSRFFTELGCMPVLSDGVDAEGINHKRTSLCFPGEISHGCFHNLIGKKTDFIFLPKIVELYVDNSQSRRKEHQCTCLLLQAEPYCLTSAFKDCATQSQILSPTMDFSQGWDTQQEEFVKLGNQVGATRRDALRAYSHAVDQQLSCFKEFKAHGRKFLADLEKNPNQIAIVLFGRPYNAFAQEANMGIPAKFASAGVQIIPWDFLPFEHERCEEDMCWAIGQNLLKASAFVEKHPQLYGAFVTNFSCGPDSFLVGYFRDIMRGKPSLTLELDSHTADAGINTRIEAFIDIVDRYRALKNNEDTQPIGDFAAADIIFEKGRPFFISSDKEKVSLYDKRVHILIPSMGKLTAELLASVFTGGGIRASAIPVYDNQALKAGRGCASCKECLPLLLTAGGLLKYLENRTDSDELLVYFMPTSSGNCRFTQYNVFLRKLVNKNKLRNVAFLTLTNENGYAGLMLNDMLNMLKSIIVADVMEDIKNALRVLSADADKAMEVFDSQWKRLTELFAKKRGKGLYDVLEEVARTLSAIKLSRPLSGAAVVALLGEIFVRREYFSCRDLVERLAKRGIIVKRAPVFEWLSYCDYNVVQGIYESEFTWVQTMAFRAKRFMQSRFERKIKKIMAESGLYEYEPVDMDAIMAYGKNFFDPRFTGEAILVAGAFFKDILHHVHGAISIGPFACMPTRVIEAVLSAQSTPENKRLLDKKVRGIDTEIAARTLPFLSVESDGNPFPQIIEARIEAFCLQVERLHTQLKSATINPRSADHAQIHIRHRRRRLVAG